jgi:integrase
MRNINKLVQGKVETLAPGRYGDGLGLWLQVDPRGHRSWVFRYSSGGRGVAMGLGATHTVSLADARGRAREARRLLLDGVDPLDAKHAARKRIQLASASRMTFAACVDAYLDEHTASWSSVKHQKQWATSIARATKVFGTLDVAAIDTDVVIKFLGPIWRATPETARRIRGRIETVLDWAGARKFRSGENPARWQGKLEHLLRAKPNAEHHVALPYSEIGAFMADLRERESMPARALELTILAAARTAETLGARWDEIDGDTWTVPATRMKSRKAHRVPLSKEAIALLDALPRTSELVFPSSRNGRPIVGHAMWDLLHSMRPGGQTVHGFRSTFSDWARERTAYPRDVIEMALAHTIKDKSEAAYRRGDALDKRRRLMTEWGRFCMEPATGGEVVALHG